MFNKTEHEEFYARLKKDAEMVLDRIEEKLERGDAISADGAANLACAIAGMMKSETKMCKYMAHGGKDEL